MAQVGVKVVRNDPAGDNSCIVRFKPSDAGVSLSGGLGWKIPEVGRSLSSKEEAANLLDWIDQRYPSQAGEIRCIGVNYLKDWKTGGLTFRDADFQGAPKYAGTSWIEMDCKNDCVLLHEILHVLLNAEHNQYSAEYDDGRNIWTWAKTNGEARLLSLPRLRRSS